MICCSQLALGEYFDCPEDSRSGFELVLFRIQNISMFRSNGQSKELIVNPFSANVEHSADALLRNDLSDRMNDIGDLPRRKSLVFDKE